jgi:hypothetical protein
LAAIYLTRYKNQNIQGVHKTKLSKNQSPNEEMASEVNRSFSKEEV